VAKVTQKHDTGWRASNPDGDLQNEPTDPGSGYSDQRPSRWRLNLLGALLAATLAASLLLSLALSIGLARTRAELDKRAEEPGQAASQPRQPEAPRAPPAPAEGAAPVVGSATSASTPPAGGELVAEDRLFLLLTVGTRHYAEKQLRLLRPQCKAPLAVYLQRKGRCAWNQCFVVAAREFDMDRARECGKTTGQALRERADFILVR